MIGKTEGLYGCKVDKSIVIMVDGKRWNALRGGVSWVVMFVRRLFRILCMMMMNSFLSEISLCQG
jgi:hypothetical protein